MNSFSRFLETELPPRRAFYSQLNDRDITEDEYKMAQEAWTEFGCLTMKNYHDFYLTLDVTILADVFENFRAISHAAYGLDPAHYWTLPGFSWDACLKETRVDLELFEEANSNMYLFFENAVRGGVSMIAHRYAKSNNGEEIDPTQPPSWLTYLDANNLYGWAMSQPLPTGNFRWLGEREIREFTPEFIQSIADDSSTGYVAEVDLVYPEELHELHNAFPLAPERLENDKSAPRPGI